MNLAFWALLCGPCFVDPAFVDHVFVDPVLWTLLRGLCFVDLALWTFVDPALQTCFCGPRLVSREGVSVIFEVFV